MAINYSVLTAGKTTQGSIANWVNRGDLPTENILLEAEALIYQHLRVREMMAMDDDFTFAIATSSTALPSGFLDPIQFLPWAWEDELEFWHEASFKAPRDDAGSLYEGLPCRWTIIGETAHVDVLCESAFGGVLLYYEQPAALSTGNPTNFLTTRYPKLLRYACMSAAYEHMKDWSRAKEYEMRAADAARSVKMTDDMFRRSQHVTG